MLYRLPGGDWDWETLFIIHIIIIYILYIILYIVIDIYIYIDFQVEIGIGRHYVNFSIGFTILFGSEEAFDAAVAIDKVGLKQNRKLTKKISLKKYP